MATKLFGYVGPSENCAETQPIATLTEREREVLSLLADRLGNPAIAKRSFLSEGTVRHCLTGTDEDLGVSDRQQAAGGAVRNRSSRLPELDSTHRSADVLGELVQVA